MNELMKLHQYVGVVVIGRNEGERLKRCLVSCLEAMKYVVYVDSGSTDNSLAIAQELGVEVVKLDMTKPFTAARARNTGFHRLLELYQNLQYVQFVDGDCELNPNWIELAINFLTKYSTIGVICGRRRERFPERSIYNLLCDIEWDTPIGEAKSCGGDALFRIDAFNQVNGFKNNLIAGEEPELCLRLRQAGWKVWRLDAEMTLHDADMTRFSQWWKRAVRAGYAFAEGAYLHRGADEKYRIRETQKILFWSIGLPIIIVFLSLFNPWSSLLLLAYPLQVLRLAIKGGNSPRENWLYSFFLVLGKFPETVGQIKYFVNRVLGRSGVLIEYK